MNTCLCELLHPVAYHCSAAFLPPSSIPPRVRAISSSLLSPEPEFSPWWATGKLAPSEKRLVSTLEKQVFFTPPNPQTLLYSSEKLVETLETNVQLKTSLVPHTGKDSDGHGGGCGPV